MTVDQARVMPALTSAELNSVKASVLAEYEMARRSFREFLQFVKIPQPGTGMIPLQQWPYVLKVLDSLEQHDSLAITKARQIGFTTLLSAYALWHAQFVPYGLVLNFSKGEREAWQFLSKSRATYETLPAALQIPLGEPDNREQMTFKNGGQILVLPSTEGAGRGLNPTLALIDEADRHEYLDAAYNSVKPGLSDNHGQLVMFSTINPYKIGGLFQEMYQNAPANGFYKAFYGWRERPGRDDEWYEEERKKYQDQALFQKEFPETEAEAFAPAKAIAAFDLDVLTKMSVHVRDPLQKITLGNGIQANIWREFEPGRRYVAATDTAHGVGLDFSVTGIIDITDRIVVADIFSNVLDPRELGVASVDLLNRYDSPIWAIEDNDWGILTIRAAQELKYKKLYYRDEGKPGWHTFDTATSSGSRYEMWGDLIEVINGGSFTIPNKEGLGQLFTVIRNPDKRGRIEAQQGAHDDYPTWMSIAWQLRSLSRPAAGDRGSRRDVQLTGLETRKQGRRWNPW